MLMSIFIFLIDLFRYIDLPYYFMNWNGLLELLFDGIVNYYKCMDWAPKPTFWCIAITYFILFYALQLPYKPLKLWVEVLIMVITYIIFEEPDENDDDDDLY